MSGAIKDADNDLSDAEPDEIETSKAVTRWMSETNDQEIQYGEYVKRPCKLHSSLE